MKSSHTSPLSFSPPCFPPSNQPLDLHLYALGCHKIKQPTPTPQLKNNQFFCVFFSTLIHAKTEMKHTQKTHETKHTNCFQPQLRKFWPWFLQTHYGNMNYLLLIDSSKPIMGIWTICYWLIPPNPLWEYELSVTDWFPQTHYGNMNYLLLTDSPKPITGIWTICFVSRSQFASESKETIQLVPTGDTFPPWMSTSTSSSECLLFKSTINNNQQVHI